jgi:hypothetical protein
MLLYFILILFVFLFKYTLFNNASSSSDYVYLNGNFISEFLTVKDVKRKYRGVFNRKVIFEIRN